MPRPSLKHQRQQGILDAFARCVARYGVEGSTQDLIAKEAGIARPLLRHNLGNRDEMIEKLLAHIVERFAKMTEDLIAALPEAERPEALIELLFTHGLHASENASVFQALVAASEQHTSLRAPLMGFILQFEGAIAGELHSANPKTPMTRCKTVASGIAALYFTADATLPLLPTADWLKRQKQAASLLLSTL